MLGWSGYHHGTVVRIRSSRLREFMSFYSIRPDRGRPAGWHILTLFDVPFYVEPSFLVLVLIFFYSEAHGSGSFIAASLTIFVIFFSILFHEAGHALTARAFGLREVSASLHMLGGTARHPITTNGRNLVITLAGPACTALITLVTWMMLRNEDWILRQREGFILVIVWAFRLNLFLLVFNILPIYPMDGGQSLLYLLNFKLRFERALQLVAYASLVTTGLVAVYLYGIQRHPIDDLFMLFFLISFVWTNTEILKQIR